MKALQAHWHLTIKIPFSQTVETMPTTKPRTSMFRNTIRLSKYPPAQTNKMEEASEAPVKALHGVKIPIVVMARKTIWVTEMENIYLNRKRSQWSTLLRKVKTLARHQIGRFRCPTQHLLCKDEQTWALHRSPKGKKNQSQRRKSLELETVQDQRVLPVLLQITRQLPLSQSR